jgi:peptidoglycan hydrolase CwlO-like protein
LKANISDLEDVISDYARKEDNMDIRVDILEKSRDEAVANADALNTKLDRYVAHLTASFAAGLAIGLAVACATFYLR